MATTTDKGGRYKPEPFHGSEGEDPTEYMADFEAIRKHYKYTVTDRISILVICCKERAKSFINSYLKRVAELNPAKEDYGSFDEADWNVLKEAFIKYFVDSDIMLRLQLQRCAQIKGETSKAYAERLAVLMEKVSKTMTDTEKISHFCNNLLPSIKEPVIIAGAATFREAIECATRVEIAIEVSRSRRIATTVNNIATSHDDHTADDDNTQNTTVNAVTLARHTAPPANKLDEMAAQIAKLTALLSQQSGNNPNNSNNSGPRRFNGRCHFCNNQGHRIADCRKRQAQERQGTVQQTQQGQQQSQNNQQTASQYQQLQQQQQPSQHSFQQTQQS